LLPVHPHVALVVDDTNNQMTLYKNGAFESAVAFPDSLSLLNDINNWIGRSQYATDSAFAGTLQELRIYGAALSESSVLASYVAGPDPAFLNQCHVARDMTVGRWPRVAHLEQRDPLAVRCYGGTEVAWDARGHAADRQDPLGEDPLGGR
jgi:hypothetical protein